MNRLFKLVLMIRTFPRTVMLKRAKVSNSDAFVIARASAGYIDWYLADNVAEKRLKKTR